MASPKRWQPREGFSADVIARLVNGTLLSTSLTLPLFLLTKFTSWGQEYGERRPGVVRVLRLLLSIGLYRTINAWLSRRSLNNGVSDTYNWRAEIAVVTGGSDGIGKRIALLLAARGLKVAVLDVQPLKYEHPANIEFFLCDICSSEQIAGVAQQIRAKMGEPTILVNNAGILKGKTILGGTEAETRQTFEVNTMSHYWLTRQFLPHMVSRNHGMVVTVASLASHVTSANLVDYSASKAAALAFHEGLAGELRSCYSAPKVRTVLVTPGFVNTQLVDVIRPGGSLLTPLLHPDTVAEAVTDQILTGRSGNVILPIFSGNIVSNVRSFPHWLQKRFRNEGARLMSPRSRG
ncbi:hypothetical protein LOZ57_001839 [Ophidiomyces ophidiicola]|uniref:uncharacterized protein n=1 Tax=Ophidiomyces ophidiicola TaxID=1387563 RepID=UPI0020C247F5|nr:uncharacterized protein LOZ57_001839 [Ophidiomyces ophidiicola]KAI1951284.1 hypothetical protein LOZ57_001839 [Ophidiomyces ophidiicola]KAI2060699.1 hypothetical protein LOZ43_001524 [Ophidiomyces ophidiicola]